VQLSFNLFNLFTGPSQMKLAEAGVALADQRRVATQMAVLAQVHLARQQYANALQQFERADAIWQTDSKISEHIKNREQAQAQSKLDVVANQTTAILSLLRRYQAMSQLQGAEARLQATLGVEQSIPSVSEISLNDLTRDIGRGRDVWISLKVPAQAPSTGAAQ
jgi:tetratricopeptide (TPR) repeat protein